MNCAIMAQQLIIPVIAIKVKLALNMCLFYSIEKRGSLCNKVDKHMEKFIQRLDFFFQIYFSMII